MVLLHPADDCSHESRHCASVPPFPGEDVRYASPAPELHCLPYPIRPQLTAWVSGWNLIVVAPALMMRDVHAVLKWLHQVDW